MAKQMLVPINMGRNEIQNVVMQVLAVAPGSPVEGLYYYDSALKKPRIYADGDWVDMVGADGTVTDVSADAPLSSTGGTTPTISIPAADDATDGYMSQEYAAKLDGIEAGATGDQTASELLTAIKTVDGAASGLDADLLDGNNGSYFLDRANHTGTQSADTLVDGATNHVFTAADDTKLGGIEAGATGDQTAAEILAALITVDGAGSTLDADFVDGASAADLRARSSHTGTQALGTITGHDKAAHDALGIDAATLEGDSLADVRDRASHTGTQALGTITGHDKAAHDALDIDAETTGGATAAQLRDRATHTGTQASSTISDFAEGTRDALGAILTDSATLDFTYDDAANAGVGTISGAVLDSPTVAGNTPAQLRDRSTHTGTQALGTITGHDKAAHDALDIDAATLEGLTAAQVINGLATETYVDTAVADLVDTAPGTLDTLNELAAALGDDPNFATTVTDAIALRTRKYAQSIGNGALTTITVTHNLNTTDVTVQLYRVSDGVEFECDVTRNGVNTVVLGFTVAPTTNQYRCVIVG